MSDRTQIGPAVDAELWQRFRDDVKARKGQVRGVLGDELETAIRQYLDDSPREIEQRIDARLARLERATGVSESDGGLYTSDADTHTHTPSRLDSPDKPAANASTDKKLVYLAECVIDREVPNTRELTQVPKGTLRQVVKDEYGFRSDTARRYVDELVSWFDLVPHPDNADLLITPDEREQILDEQRADISDRADDRMDDLDAEE